MKARIALIALLLGCYSLEVATAGEESKRSEGWYEAMLNDHLAKEAASHEARLRAQQEKARLAGQRAIRGEQKLRAQEANQRKQQNAYYEIQEYLDTQPTVEERRRKLEAEERARIERELFELRESIRRMQFELERRRVERNGGFFIPGP